MIGTTNMDPMGGGRKPYVWLKYTVSNPVVETDATQYTELETVSDTSSSLSYDAYSSASISSDGNSIVLSDDDFVENELLEDIITNNHYFTVNDTVYHGGFFSYSESQADDGMNAFYGYKCVIGDHKQGEELLGLVTGRYEDDYPENGRLNDYWYIRVNTDYDLEGANTGMGVIPSYLIPVSNGSSTWYYAAEWIDIGPGRADSDYKIISKDISKHPSSVYIEHDIVRSDSFGTSIHSVPEIKLKCTCSGVYVLTVDVSVAYRNSGDLNFATGYYKIFINDTDITSIVSAEGCDDTIGYSNTTQNSYWVNLKKGDIVKIKHIGGTYEYVDGIYGASSSKSGTAEWTDDNICVYGYCDNSKSTRYLNYYLSFCFWNYGVTTDEKTRLVTLTDMNRNDNFEVIE